MASSVCRTQCSIAAPITVDGVGLHSGEPVHVRMRPAPDDTGIVFVRTDMEQAVLLDALSENVVSTTMNTTLGKHGVTLATVEHCLAAIVALGVDNVFVDVDGPEMPVLDGSSMPWVRAILEAGVREGHKTQNRIVVHRPVEVRDGDRWARLSPRHSGHGLLVRCEIAFDHPLIHRQTIEFDLSASGFLRDIASARTWGFKREVDALHAAGLGLGGSLDNAVVLDDFHVLNDGGLRYPDEFVRHKVLDAVGDLAQLGAPVDGVLELYKSGHGVHHQLCKALLAQPDAYSILSDAPQAVLGAPARAPVAHVAGQADWA